MSEERHLDFLGECLNIRSLAGYSDALVIIIRPHINFEVGEKILLGGRRNNVARHSPKL